VASRFKALLKADLELTRTRWKKALGVLRSHPNVDEALFEELERSLEQGYAVSDEDVTPGIASLGAPVFDYTGRIRAAVSIGGLRPLLLDEMRDEAIELLVTGARDISAALGHTA